MTTDTASPPATCTESSWGRWLRHPIAGQLARFGMVGVVSTGAYALLYLMLRPLAGSFGANALALLITALANTAVNRRLTFGVRGAAGLAGDHAVGLIAFAAGLALTTGSLAVLHATGATGRGVELVVLTAANAIATLVRFVALRLRICGPAGAVSWAGTGPAAGGPGRSPRRPAEWS
jgi:putative flippase GtrA